MFRTTHLIAAGSGIVAAAAATVLAVTPAAANSHHTKTIKLRSGSPGTVSLNQTHYLQASVLRRVRHGKVRHKGAIATFTCHLISSSEASCLGSFTLKGGQLIGSTTFDYSNGALVGHIARGTGSFAGAHGTIKDEPRANGHAILILTYTK